MVLILDNASPVAESDPVLYHLLFQLPPTTYPHSMYLVYHLLLGPYPLSPLMSTYCLIPHPPLSTLRYHLMIERHLMNDLLFTPPPLLPHVLAAVGVSLLMYYKTTV